MPAESNSVHVTIYVEDTGNLLNLELTLNQSVEDMKAIIEAETTILIKDQHLSLNEKELANNSATLADANIKNNDLLTLRKKKAVPAFTPQPQQPQFQDITQMTPAQAQNYIKNNPALIQRLMQTSPQLVDAAFHPDDSKMKILFQQINSQKLHKQKLDQLYARLALDPFDVEAQKLLEEMIAQENIVSNYETALEHMPEAFAQVIMLYVDCKVNNIPLKAFVDSGAQMTIMSKACAERCNLTRLLDKQFAGVAVGVGQAKILGRIHMTQLQVGKSFFNVSITVIDQQGLEFILGLDMLRRHQCSIDLKDNVLRMGTEVVPFLQEKDIPKDLFHKNVPQSPLSPAPNSNIFNIPPQQAQQPKPVQQQQAPKPQSPPQQLSAEMTAKIQQLVDLGFTREQSIQALRQANGNVDLAASILFQM